MLRNYLTTALRYLRKNKMFSLLNILGLAIGLACCMLIALFVFDELSYDSYPAAAADIYRVEIHLLANNGMMTYPTVDIAVGEGIQKTFPTVKGYTRLLPDGPDYWGNGEKQFKETRMGYADSNFFSFFSLPLVEGNAATVLTEPNSIVISRSLANKYFGRTEAIGKYIMSGQQPIKVTGVMEEMPDNSHFHFDGVISMATLHRTGHTWSNAVYYTYLQLAKGADPKKVEAGMPKLVEKYVVPEVQHDENVSLAEAQKSINTFLFVLQPLRDIHFHGMSTGELEHNGDIQYVYIFSALAVFILVLACVNFINLSTAIASKRGKEVGIRKVLGSLKRQLVSQFLAEAVLLAFFALLVAIGLVIVLLPYFNELAGKHFTVGGLLHFRTIAVLLTLGLITGVCAGSYPAFFSSSFNAIQALKGRLSFSRGRGISLRSGLVVFQFFISTALIIGTLIAYRQLQYMQRQKLGYDKDQLVFVEDVGLLGGREAVAFKQQVTEDSRVVNASVGSQIPGNERMGGALLYPKERQAGYDAVIPASVYVVDYNYIPTLGMKIIGGRNFSRDFPTDSAGDFVGATSPRSSSSVTFAHSVIINEAAVRELGWSRVDPIGKTIVGSNNDEYKVVGVVADFNYVSLKHRIEPLMMLLSRRPGGGLIIKVNTRDMTGFLRDLEHKWKTLKPGSPFSWYFPDEAFAKLYAGERRTAQLFQLFALLSILIACLGLFGLAAFTTEQRAKEIGIRKVLGASVQQVLLLVAKEFLLVVGIAFVLAVPAAWWAMHVWLQDFAYRAPVEGWVFLLGGFMTILIALVTVSARALGAALANPIRSLRSE
ncbi:MAG TPA: ABC transporter permease [Puia sp.]|jgi:putative ABC transport system permease protein